MILSVDLYRDTVEMDDVVLQGGLVLEEALAEPTGVQQSCLIHPSSLSRLMKTE